jgi:topoisomerase-4 subunit B
MILKRLWHYAYLNTGLTLLFNGETICSENGLLDLLNDEVKEDRLYEPLALPRQARSSLPFSTLRATARRIFLSSTGNIRKMAEPTSLRSEKGFLKGVNEYAKKNFQGVDVREGIVGAILIKVKDPVFESQTKNKLSNNEIRGPIVQEVKDAVQTCSINILRRARKSSSGSSLMKS